MCADLAPKTPLAKESREGKWQGATRIYCLSLTNEQAAPVQGETHSEPARRTASTNSALARSTNRQRRPAATRARHESPQQLALVPVKVPNTSFSSGRGWRGPCPARTVTTVTICCKLRLCEYARCQIPGYLPRQRALCDSTAAASRIQGRRTEVPWNDQLPSRRIDARSQRSAR